MSRLTLVRHGQASFLAADYDQLSELGERQCRLLGSYWAAHGITYDCIYVGPCKRHRQSTEAAAEGYREAGGTWPEQVDVPGLDEFSWGELMEYAKSELSTTDPHIAKLRAAFEDAPDRAEKSRTIQHLVEAVTQQWVNGTLQHPTVEPWTDFQKRVLHAVEVMTAGTPSGHRAAVFTSGGPVAVTIQRALHLTPEKTLELIWTLRNGAIAEFLYSGSRFNLASFNDAPHLQTPDLWTYR
ncbi:MAG: hypothetical protein GC168_20320 [Candidatus Hydrogenedens sp.]|nr:hypothetical protein [Candidatus Hydrogenedens sp.]